jgi:hypothetical protein
VARQQMRPRFFEKRDNLLALHAGEALEELLDRITRLQVIEQASRRDTRASKDGFTAENFGILSDDLAHRRNLERKSAEREPALARLLERIELLPSAFTALSGSGATRRRMKVDPEERLQPLF